MKLLVLVALLASAWSLPASADCTCLFIEVGGTDHTEVRRQGTTQFVKARLHERVQTGDFLRLGDPPDAVLLCDGGRVALRSPPALQVVPCPDGAGRKPNESRALWNGSGRLEGELIDPTRGAPDAGAIIVLAPRRTSVRSARPTLQWRTVPGVTTYQLTVRGTGLVWQGATTTTPGSPLAELEYPGTPALQPGGIYKVLVSGGGRASDIADVPGMGFKLLSSKEVESIAIEESAIRAEKLDADTEAVAIALVDSGHDLLADAITTLAARSTSTDPELLRMLGILYARVRLYGQAESTLQKVIAKPISESDGPDGQAKANLILSEVAAARGDIEGATARLRAARALLESLGDVAGVVRADKRLTQMKSAK